MSRGLHHQTFCQGHPALYSPQVPHLVLDQSSQRHFRNEDPTDIQILGLVLTSGKGMVTVLGVREAKSDN